MQFKTHSTDWRLPIPFWRLSISILFWRLKLSWRVFLEKGGSESVSTGVWCVPGLGAGFEIALEPSELQKEGENPSKGHFYFLRQTLVCTKPWFKRDLRGTPKRGYFGFSQERHSATRLQFGHGDRKRCLRSPAGAPQGIPSSSEPE